MTDVQILEGKISLLLAGHFGVRPFSEMAIDRFDLRQRVRTGDYDINEATQADCLDAARDVVALTQPQKEA